MIQGDEPMINPLMIEEAISPMLKDEKILVSNLLAEIKDETEFLDKNCIKVVCDNKGNALYFSRMPIPSINNELKVNRFKQVCVIPFKRDFLLKYISLDPTPLEVTESIDMNRVIEHGYKVKMVKTEYKTQAVDTVDDLIKVESLLK